MCTSVVRGITFASIAWSTSTVMSAAPLAYHATLDERAPLNAVFSLDLPAGRIGETLLAIKPRSEASLIGTPQCDGEDLVARASTRWAAPPGCRAVRWRVVLRDEDRDPMDASDPSSGWSGRGRWWLLTDRLAILTPRDGWQDATLAIATRLRDGGQKTNLRQLPRPGQPPFYGIASATGPRRYQSSGFHVNIYGDVPLEADSTWQRFLTTTWNRWRRDILPGDATAPTGLDILWVPPPPHAEPAFLASAGTGAILMQNIAGTDRAAADAKLRAALMLGTHEGFHALIGSIAQSWPAWVNESWASYFAYRAARPHLRGNVREAVAALIDAPASESVLEVQAELDRGDGSHYDVFYGKGARFWAAIEGVLVTRSNPSGRLAALIQDTRGFQGLDWSKPTAIAAYLDARSDGRASRIAQCYLVDRGCLPTPSRGWSR